MKNVKSFNKGDFHSREITLLYNRLSKEKIPKLNKGKID